MAERFDWIELVVKASRIFGLNQVRVRWKLRAWQNRMKSSRDRAVMEGRSLTRGLKTCPACGSIAGVKDRSCPHCGARLYSAPIEFFRRIFRRAGIGVYAETGIAAACVIVFILSTVGSMWQGLGPMAIVSPSSLVLTLIGGNYAPDTVNGEWWRLWTSIFLHGGIMHLAFNLMALYIVAPRAREYYGSNRMLVVYALCGLAASAASTWWSMAGVGHAVSIGASGAISGIIGLMFIRGWLDRSRAGIDLRNQMLRWMAYTIVFGYIIGADNAAHLGGFAAGSLFGTILPRTLRSPFPGLEKAAGALVLIAIAGAVGWIAFLLLYTPLPILPAP